MYNGKRPMHLLRVCMSVLTDHWALPACQITWVFSAIQLNRVTRWSLSDNRQNFHFSFRKVPKIFTCPPQFLPVPDRRTVSNFRHYTCTMLKFFNGPLQSTDISNKVLRCKAGYGEHDVNWQSSDHSVIALTINFY